MIKRDPFEDEVAKLTTCISVLVQEQQKKGLDPNSWLQTLYESKTNEFINNNDKIWTTGSIMIPISLAGFAAFASIDDPKLVQLLILMIASILLMFVWLVIAENQRAFQRKSEAWLTAIERTIKIADKGGAKVKGNWVNRLLTGGGMIQNIRWILFVFVCMGWIMILFLVLRGVYR